jgi:hypothetical protein
MWPVLDRNVVMRRMTTRLVFYPNVRYYAHRGPKRGLILSQTNPLSHLSTSVAIVREKLLGLVNMIGGGRAPSFLVSVGQSRYARGPK